MEELDLKELFEMFWNKKVQIILVVCAFIVLGLVYTIFFVTPLYEASTTLVLVTTGSEDTTTTTTNTTITTTDLTINSKLVTTYSELIKSDSVIREVISNLDIDINEDSLKENITVTSIDDTELIKIAVTNIDPQIATNIANEIVEVFSIKIEEIYKIDNVYILNEAELPDGASNINHAKDIVLFAFIGLFLAAGIVFIINMLDTTVKSQEEIEKKLGIQVISLIPMYDLDMEKKGKK